MDFFLKAAAGGLVQGALTLGKVALIVIPLITLMEVARQFKLLDRLQRRAGKIMGLLKLPPQAAFPLLVGMFFGLLYGAALIIDYIREGYLRPRDVTVLAIFLSINHAVIEDTALFAAVGANPLVLLPFRLLTAIICTRLTAWIIDFRTPSNEDVEK